MADSKDQKIEDLQTENKCLREQVRFLSAKLYGPSSEKTPLDHPDLFDPSQFGQSGLPETQEAVVKTVRKKRPNSRPRIPEHLPVEETIIDPPEVIKNPEAWKLIGQEKSERIAINPARIYVKRTIRRKYTSTQIPADEPNQPIIASLPSDLVPQCILDLSMIVQIIIGKYCDHLPLDRQAKIFSDRHGVVISAQTMGNAVKKADELLAPIVDQMAMEQFNSDYLQGDETPIRYLAPGNGKSGQGYLWAFNQPGSHAVFHWKTGRSAGALKEILPESFTGDIQCDGYKVYEAVQKARGIDKIGLPGCWAHVRRKFTDAASAGLAKEFNGEILSLVQKLYRIEDRLRKSKAPPDKRNEARQTESKPIIESIETKLREKQQETGYLPKDLTGKAISYALNQWERLLIYLEKGNIEIDNNWVENKIRPTKLGAKNWLFFGSAEAGHRSATMFSLTVSCRNLGIEPSEYLHDVLARILDGESPENLVPAVWAQDKVEV